MAPVRLQEAVPRLDRVVITRDRFLDWRRDMYAPPGAECVLVAIYALEQPAGGGRLRLRINDRICGDWDLEALKEATRRQIIAVPPVSPPRDATETIREYRLELDQAARAWARFTGGQSRHFVPQRFIEDLHDVRLDWDSSPLGDDRLGDGVTIDLAWIYMREINTPGTSHTSVVVR